MATTKAFELAQLSGLTTVDASGNVTTNTSQIANASGDLTFDSVADIILDADGAQLRFYDNGVEIGVISSHTVGLETQNLLIGSQVSDRNIIFQGLDNTTQVQALVLDMSASGAATFNDQVTIGGNLIHAGNLTIDAGGDITLNADGADVILADGTVDFGRFKRDAGDFIIKSETIDKDIVIKGTTTSNAVVTAMTFDMSNSGRATFNENVVIQGDLTVEGSTVTLNTTDLNVEDKNITLNYHASNDTSASAGGSGITIQDAVSQGNDATILWDDTNDEFDFSHTVNVTGNLVSDGLTVDGNSTFNTAGTLFANLNYGGANKGRFTTDGIDIKIEATSNLQLIANSVLSAKINGTGDISFYEDNSGTPQVGMHWDYTDGYLGIGDTAPEAPLFVNGNESTITDLTPVLWARSKTGASITQMNVKGDQIQFGGGATLDTSPAMTIDYGSNNVGIGTDDPSTALHVDPGYVTLGTSSGTDNSWINNVEDGNLELVNEGRSTNDGAVRINRKNNPAGDTTYFRDTAIYDGKSNIVLFVDGSEGEVGIGTTAPTSKLEVFTTDQDFEDDSNAIRITHPAGPFQFDVGGGLVFAQRWYDQSTQDVRTGGIYGFKTIGSGAYGGGLAFYSQPNNADPMNRSMVINHATNVGIGTDDPDCALDVTRTTGWAEMHLDGASGGDLILKDNGVSYGEVYAGNGHGLVIKSYSGQDIYFLTDANATPKMVIESGGNVGIGVDPAVHKLDVDGAIATRQVRHTIRPSLNIDFANSKTLHPRMTFSRRSGATYYDEDGILRYASNNVPRFNHDPETGESLGLLIEYDATNIIPSSEHFSLFSTSRAEIIKNRALAPDDTMSAIQIGSDTAATSRVIHDFSLFSPAASSTYTVSCYAKASGSTVFSMELGAGANNGQSAFDLSAGTASTPTFGGTVSNAVSYIQPIRNGWYRCILVVTHSSSWSGTTNVAFYDQTNFNDNGTKKEGILVWGPQIESGTFATSYTPSYTEFNSRSSRATYFDKTGTLKQASEDVLREGYLFDGRSFKPTGPIIEPARTNYFKYSSTSNCWYNAQTATQSYGYPDIAGSNHSTKVGSSLTGYSITNSLTANTHYCYSVFVKNINASSVGFYVDASFGTGFSHTFSTSTWNTSVNNTNVLADGVQNYGNGWYRMYVTFVTDSDGGVAAPRVQAGGGEAYFCFPQIEEGHTPTSYIHNYGSTATRAADVHNSYQSVPRRSDICEMLDVEDLIPQPTGTVFTEWNYAEPAGGFAGIFEIRDEGTVGIDHRVASNVVQYYVSNSSINLGGYPTPVVPSTTDPRNEYQKTALAYDFDSRLDHQTFRNGVLQSSNTSSTTDMYLKDIRLGSIDFNPAYQLNGHIKSFKLYPSRIDNAHGVALTENN